MGVIYTFFGADHKCGTSMIAQCVAERLSQKFPQCNVLLLHAESGCGRDFSPAVSESLDNIEKYLSEKVLDTSDFFRRSRYKDNLYILGGSAGIGNSANYHPEMCEYLLCELENCFQYIVCDGGCNIEHGMSLGALLSCSKSYLVSSQSESAIKRYGYVKPLFEKLDYRFEKLLVSKYDKRSIISKEMLASRLGFTPENSFCIPFSSFGNDAELDEKSLLCYRDNAFIKAIDTLIGEMLKEA